MHGAIVHSLERFVAQAYGRAVLTDVLAASGIAGTHLMPTRVYADADVMAVLQSVVERTGQPVQVVLERFGEFLAPVLLGMYGMLIDRSWGTLDLIEHTEDTIHRVVRARDPAARPPALRSVRTARDEVRITYASPRRMCHLAVGIARGIAEHFGDRIAVAQPVCMHAHGDHCEIVIRTVPQS